MMFKTLLGAGLSATLLAGAAYAQDNIAVGADPIFDPVQDRPGLSWTVGIAATARFATSDDFDHAENEVEGFVELAYSGFHGGLTITTLYQDPADDVEYEANLGYGAEFGNGMSWDLTYGYIWPNNTDGHSEEITATLAFPVTDSIDGAFAVIVDPDTGKSDQEFAFEAPLNDRWSLVGLVGNSDRDDNVYGELGAVYAINDSTAFQVLYEDTNDSGGLLGFTVSYEFGG
ncbi:hypothetical protein JQW92_17865 [Sulfitobacter pseudonitzschiae]|uniref:hypothetical protein n=2 Tax=Pseudosulfitobacter pseudonitzschiae TaxID=1402135 RepID=UPI001D9677D5|nr:hypothetical protein [Pseudosulfitobacter pseudonitzschiae]MBM1834124.1 hypothetical protein [Pseudosulfitobacter pseudonitzschiae]MBM1838990.1 hypothetical protein [Pseudosulfitobacter pseudonitzschiae]MBM1843839.1 hypothetical protein [Pseudosulfitobacter pseudonitzschiae]MBM1858387.1 hypothetical protein [Pseudosulfitobacter pseudonitzschiae]MBM1887509.1 hypothetical protein [Pseudosulfitobacter pseudonitzschiae]